MTKTLLAEIDTSDKPVKLKAGLVAKFKIYELSFSQFARTITEASRTTSRTTTAKDFSRTQRGLRRAEQIKGFDAGGTEIKIEPDELLRLPRALYVRVMAALDAPSDKPKGEIVAPGDGADTPIIYRLGTGMKLSGATGEQTVTDLEIIAKTGGDIEDVLIETGTVAQTLALLEHCATPLTKDLGLISLPSWALDQITMADGFEIMEKVLPSFLE